MTKLRRGGSSAESIIYGYHAVDSALRNPSRESVCLHGTNSSLSRLDSSFFPSSVRECSSSHLDSLTSGGVHQGLVLECMPLELLDSSELFLFSDSRLLVCLDRITDPRNVGAILRSCVAFGVDGILLPHRGGAPLSGVTAKAASGAVDLARLMSVRHLSKVLDELSSMNFFVIGLDGSSSLSLDSVLSENRGRPLVLVIGSEGFGLREQTRSSCDVLTRLPLPGLIKTLNASTAATLSLYMARTSLDTPGV